MNNSVCICFAGDICGKLGIDVLLKNLPILINKYSIDFVFVNAENAENGSGISPCNANEIFDCGVDVITGGNHTLEKFDVRSVFGYNERILRPANYPPTAPGAGYVNIKKNGIDYTVCNLQGREGMHFLDCPFRSIDLILKNISNSIILIDFHAESTQEKEAMAYYIDGRASFLGGTHTHVQTADARILPGGIGYITDVGMIGAFDSVIGGDPVVAIRRIRTQVYEKIPLVQQGKGLFSAILVQVDTKTKKTISVKPIMIIDD